MTEKEACSGRSAIRVGLVVSCLASVACVALELVCLGRDLPLLSNAGAIEQTGGMLQPLIAAVAVRDALQAVAVVLYCLFVFKALTEELFHRAQPRLLLSVALLIFVAAVVSVACSLLLPDAWEQGSTFMTSLIPQTDPMQFSFSFMVLALAGVFKYGGALQEDSDDIL